MEYSLSLLWISLTVTAKSIQVCILIAVTVNYTERLLHLKAFFCQKGYFKDLTRSYKYEYEELRP